MADDTVNKTSHSKFFYGWVIVAMSFLVFLMTVGVRSTFGVFLKPMMDDFGWSRTMISAAYSIHALTYCVFVTKTGQLSDKYGPRTLLMFGGLLWGSAILLTSQVTAIWHLYLVYGVMLGIALACVYIPPITTTSKWFDKKRGLALGIIYCGRDIGTLSMVPLATYLIAEYSWMYSYLILGVISLISLPIFAYFMRSPTSHLTSNHKSLDTNPSEGMTFQEALRTKTFWLLFLISTFGSTVQAVIAVHLVAFSTDIGISAVAAANAFALQGAFAIIGKIIGGRISDKIGRKRLVTLIYMLQTIMMLFLMKTTNAWMLYVYTITVGFLSGSGMPVLTAMYSDYFGSKALGAIFGFSRISWGIGSTIGPIVAGYVFDVTMSYYWAFLLYAVFYSMALISTLLLKGESSSLLKESYVR